MNLSSAAMLACLHMMLHVHWTGRLADQEIQVLLSTDLAMLPAGHQMMERLRVRLLCGISILVLLATLNVSSGHGAYAGGSAVFEVCVTSSLCEGYAEQGIHDMSPTLPFLDEQGAAACLHDGHRI
jgi:hypothetical protein